MVDGDNGNDQEDIFSGGSRPISDRVSTDVMEGPRQETATPSAPSLERTISRENVQTQLTEEPLPDLTGGYSAEAHRQTLQKMREKRRQRTEKEMDPNQYWAKKDREIAEAMKIAPGNIMAYIYAALGYVGVNMYKRDARKAVKALERKVDQIQSEIGKFQNKLDGRVKYIPPIAGQSTEEALEARKYVRESEKGLRYKLSEATDEARMLGYQYRNGVRALRQFRQKIASIDQDIETLQSNTQDATAPAKISNLQSEREQILREKDELEVKQMEYEEELKHYEVRTDRLQATISLYECITSKGERKVGNVQAGIDILRDYIRDRDDMVSVSELLKSLNTLDEDHKRVNRVIEINDDGISENLNQFKYLAKNNDPGYSTRPLMQQVGKMEKEDRVATQKDMGRILGKLGIQL